MSHRKIERDPDTERRKEYQKRDSELMKALADMAGQLEESGVDVGESMSAELARRTQIKQRFPKKPKKEDIK